MKTMRFTTLTLLVAGAYAVGEQCDDRDGAAAGPVVCAAGYTNNGSSTDIATEVAAGDAVNPAVVGSDVSTACCGANAYDAGATITFAGTVAEGIANSNFASATAGAYSQGGLTFACDSGYTAVSTFTAAFVTTDNTATTGGAGTLTGTDSASTEEADICAGDAFTGAAVTIAGTVTTAIANSNYAAATLDYTMGAAPAFACDAGYTAVTTVAATAATTNGADGALTLTVTDSAATNTLAAAICVANSYDAGKTITFAGTVAAVIPNSNFAAATTPAYNQGGLAFACDTGYTAVSTFTAAFVTTDNTATTGGAGTLTGTDTATTATEEAAICVEDTTDTTTTTTTTTSAADGSAADGSAGSADESAASPAALAAAGMAAIALLL